ncbi:TatD family deoxyribonuclease [Filobacillus milosensis]|uniref:TatD family deoxyribonuclease n=1 Tax=Filobacillus milosensis TaxID=94137 RepID=A0A4Y8IHP3_9BACI|nr:TatD family hydrolase [Filobacillus milosensis]TFB13118.1 TatD family deoxyribonuclease [Filobacillus milosensis]
MHDLTVDTHIHLDMYTEEEKSKLLHELEPYKITNLISVSRNLESCRHNLEIAKQDSRVKVALGYHPEQKIPDVEEVSDILTEISHHKDQIVAVGEVGLPYYLRKEDSSLSLEPYLELLRVFLHKAKELELPVVLHAIYEDATIVCDLLESFSISEAHFHWFRGDEKTIERMINNGYMVSVTPDVVYEGEIQKLVKDYPLRQLMVETDGPWPFEGPFSGQMTHPKMMHESVCKIAEIKRCDIKDVYNNLYLNTKRFYNL